MEVKVYILNSFAKLEGGGNPAGVVLNADELSIDEMQKISAKVGLSETAFITKINSTNFKVRFYTPNNEVDLCGHATIASFSLMLNNGSIKAGEYTIHTKVGTLKIQCEKDGTIFMQQNKPMFDELTNKNEILCSLNISKEDLIESLPVKIVSTGLRDIFIPIKSLDILYNIKPDFHKVLKLSKEHRVVGYHVFSLETEGIANANCRNFAPLYGIKEESATGTSNGALSCYLYKYGVVSENEAKKMLFEQGYSMKKPSEILSTLIIKEKNILEVKVGGRALNINEEIIEI
ncbi:PhzF family phenazine biosynthesis protein [Clostridium felsineum]|uniref:PhzF family phenazine biosynthesis protein n=1 Tax=Clostridium felsineum TaxID=36839 RepID=UPI00098CCBC5|nr:PhzF family phenazine biosynthesis protein [Clostridium felsineum]MCR3757710.1 PhzF family phenazine biosynthesis protein [Clostridium felsineum]URZ01045.1 putative isomerase YddE [Clostridium felsineum]